MSGDTNAGLFCNDSPYDENDLSILEGTYDVYSDEDSEDRNSDPLGTEPYQYEPVGLSDSALTESGSDWAIPASMHLIVASCVRSD